MSEASDAFAELQEEYEAFTGKTQTVKINGKNYKGIKSEVTYDELEVAGGNGDSGGGRVDIATALLKNKPEQGGEIEVDGVTWDILSSVNTNGVTWTITFGEIAAQEA